MKRFNLSTAVLLASLLLAACSADLRKKVPAIEDALHAGPLAQILVYSGNVALGQSGPSADGMTLSIGGTAALSAQGRDANNRPIKISPAWAASKPELIEITPRSGDMVLVKGLREGTAEIVVEYDGVRKTIEYVFIK